LNTKGAVNTTFQLRIADCGLTDPSDPSDPTDLTDVRICQSRIAHS